MQPALPVALGFPVIAPGSDDSHENDWLNSLTFLPENPLQPAHPVPLAFPIISPGSADSSKPAVDINVHHCIHGHVKEFLLRETARSLGVELIYELRLCTGRSTARSTVRVLLSVRNHAQRSSWEECFVDLSGPKNTHSLLGKKYVMIVKDDFTRYSWVYFFKVKSHAADAFKKFLADVRANGVPSEV